MDPMKEFWRFTWTDWERETELTGDGSGDPGKYFLIIRDPDGEEYACILHRTEGGRFPLDGEIAKEKEKRATMIVAALNYVSLDAA
jgi:hypothetical protein